jgi:hypothetical protein
MILHVNHLQPGLAARASEAVGTLLALVEEEQVDPRVLASLRLHLDWIQYRANFREPVVIRRATDAPGPPLALAEIAVDLRQATTEAVRDGLRQALRTIGGAAEEDARVYLDGFVPLRESIIWRFNRLFWQRLADWEAATGRGFEQALPSGRSDANHPDAVSDSVADFWTLLREIATSPSPSSAPWWRAPASCAGSSGRGERASRQARAGGPGRAGPAR